MSLERIIIRCLDVGIDCLAVADHGTTAGALKLKEMAPFMVIVAEEILTPFGEIMGLFLNKDIPSGLSIEETIDQIKAQDGLVCIPHPYDILRPSALKGQTVENIMPQVDIIEVFNSRTLLPAVSEKARQLAKKYNKFSSAGSDAHTPSEIGNAFIEMPEFDSKDSFLKSLAQGTISGRRSSPLVHMSSTWGKLKKHLF